MIPIITRDVQNALHHNLCIYVCSLMHIERDSLVAFLKELIAIVVKSNFQ